LGRLVGIDGSHALKFWPLSFLAATISLLGVWLFRAGLPVALAALVALACALDPEMRWASVLVRPESLIGLCGMALALGIGTGIFRRKARHWYWDPVAACLAVAAYAHFNAIHLVFMVAIAFAHQPRRLLRIAAKTLLFLAPWGLVVLSKIELFQHQMTTQWQRLAVPNNWLSSMETAMMSLFQALGSPEAWPNQLYLTSFGLWALILVAILFGILAPIARATAAFRLGGAAAARRSWNCEALTAPAGWILGAAWLWDSKPEVWFVYYLHAAIWSFAGLALLVLWRRGGKGLATIHPATVALTILLLSMTTIFAQVDVYQAVRLGATQSWHWRTYHEYIDCIDRTLSAYETAIHTPDRFRVWVPTFPDVTVELSRRHPDWDLTRTNDFTTRNQLALMHGHDVEAVVITEMLNWPERRIDSPMSEHPEVQSVWMGWKNYYLNIFWLEPGWKPERHLCQQGRWQAFIFMK
jgi:hypothetical protein